MKHLALSLGAALLFAGAAMAQEHPHFMFDLGTGFTAPSDVSADNLNIGWNVQGGVGASVNPWLGAKIQLQYDSMGLNRSTLFDLGFRRGNVNVFSTTFDPIIHLAPHSPIGVYVIGGTGLYHYMNDLSGPGIFGYFNPSYSVNKLGVNAGGGFEFGPRTRGKIFAEARWTRVFLASGVHADYIPVSFGFRW
jgi:hypothetical protein